MQKARNLLNHVALILHRYYHMHVYTELAAKLTPTASVAQSV